MRHPTVPPGRLAGSIVLLAVAIVRLLPRDQFAADPDHAVGVAIVSPQTAFYPGEDLVVKIVLTGAGDNETTVDAAAFARESFTLKDAEGQPPRRVTDAPAEPADQGPVTLHGFDTAERLVNLSRWYTRLTARTGSWEVSWSHGSLKAGPVKIPIVKAYNPARDKRALVQTDLGTMTWELLPEAAPQHVKHFVDLVRTGFYDGLSIFRVIPGIEAEGGDPKGDGTGAWTRVLNPEMSTKLKMGTGLVGAARQETSMTSDSMFFITLGPSDYMLGKQTFYARVTQGLEVIARLHVQPSKGDTGLRDAYLLLNPVKLQRVTIE